MYNVNADLFAVSSAQPLWMSRVSGHPENSGWGVRHLKLLSLVYLVTCKRLINCTTGIVYTQVIFMVFRNSIFHFRLHRDRLAAWFCPPRFSS